MHKEMGERKKKDMKEQRLNETMKSRNTKNKRQNTLTDASTVIPSATEILPTINLKNTDLPFVFSM
jgi:hypothetical protein